MSNYNELKLTYQGGRQETITLIGNTIDYRAYQDRNIVSVEVPEIVQTIDEYAFCDNNELANIVLNEGLQRIEGQAFQHGVYTAVTIPSTVTYIGFNSFNTRDEQDRDQHTFTITCLATTPPTLDDPEGITFGNPELLSAIYVPDGSVSAYQEAWSAYASKIQGGAPAPADDMLTNLNIKAAYVGTDEVVKMYLGNELIWGAEPEPDPMFLEPLTIVVENPGTASTTGLIWRLSGASNTSDVSEYGRSIVYSKNGGELTEVRMTGTPSTSKTVDVVIATGLSQGDIFKFYGASSSVGAYGFASGSTDGPFHYFVNYNGLTAKVYGNIKSLLTNESSWNAMAENNDKEAIDDISMNDRVFMNLFQSKTGFTFVGSDFHLVLPDHNLSTYCFKGLFKGCTRMTTAPELPATALTDSCYREMFYGCTSLISAPVLPAETLAANCYRSMFNGCTSLTAATTLPALSVPDYAYLSMFADCPITEAPALPATTLSQYCYANMFRGTNITDMPDLPATTLAHHCYQCMFSGCTSLTGVTAVLPALRVEPYSYQYMFQGCTRLTQAPELPATTLANNCYQYMFQGCTRLTQAPELPATTLANNCYQYMFQGCTSLRTAPALPATTLADICYDSMFQGCTSLTQAPKLPAETLKTQCYYSMFKDCTSLTQAPALPATTLASSCYYYMFLNCKSLRTAPVLPATKLTINCYRYMFQGCSNISFVKCLATDISATNCTQFWLNGVASTGSFYKHPNATWTTGTSGIPTGWTVKDAEV